MDISIILSTHRETMNGGLVKLTVGSNRSCPPHLLCGRASEPAKRKIKCQMTSDHRVGSRMLVRGAQRSFDPGGAESKKCSKLPENCMIFFLGARTSGSSS